MPPSRRRTRSCAARTPKYWLGRQSFWIDETVTWELLHRSLPALVLHGIPNHESTPPLYYAAAVGLRASVRLA